MKLGFNLLLWATHVTDEHWPIIERLKATGYDGVEVPMFEGSPDHFEKLGRRLKDIGLSATGVGVMSRGNAVSPDPAERAAALEHMNWICDCTAALGADLVCGPFHQPLGVFTGRGPTEDELAWCVELHKQAAQYARRSGVAISIEPLNRFECYVLNTMEQAASLVRRVNEPNFGYLFDTFHTNIEEDHPLELIPATIAEINHVHISENNRGVPGAGHIDFDAVFRALKSAGWDGWLTIEAFGSALPDLAGATKIWRPLFASEQDVYEKGFRLMKDGWARA